MEQRIIIDAHTHIFPEKIAVKASGNIGKFYDIEMEYDGMAHTLMENGDRIGCAMYLVCSTATTPAQVDSINTFVAGKCEQYDRFFGFATLHPDVEDADAALDRAVELGLHGIKLHPDFQKFYIDDEKAIAMYQKIAARGLPILFHIGDDRYDYSAPERLARAVERVPSLRCIAAHFGGYRVWDRAERVLKKSGVMFDTSSALFRLDGSTAVDLIKSFGEDRFFFGTDYPMWDAKEELARFMALDLSEETREKIFHENFERWFGVRARPYEA